VEITGRYGGGDWCEPVCGGTIKGDGTNLHAANVRLHHSSNQRIGNPGDGFLPENSEIDHNGLYSFRLLDWNSGKESSSSAGIKMPAQMAQGGVRGKRRRNLHREAALLARGGPREARVAELERFCGKLALENEILKKELSRYHSGAGTP
jgi:hypothetical protein